MGDAGREVGEVVCRHSTNGIRGWGGGYVDIEAEVDTTTDRSICRRSMLGEELMRVRSSDRRRDGNGLPFLTPLILLVFVVSIITLKGGNRNKHICLSPVFVVVVRWSLLVPNSLRPQVV